MNKYKRTAVISIGVVLLVIFVLSLPFLYFVHTSTWKYKVEDFEHFENNFTTMVTFTKEYFVSKEVDTTTNHYLYTGYDTVEKNYTLWDYSNKNSNKINITKTVQTSLNAIAKDAFDQRVDSNFHSISYCADKICFGIDNGRYCLVYTFDDKKPKFEEENKKVYIDKIKNNWYHVVFR